MLPSANLLPEELQEDKSTINESSTDPQLDELESQPEPRKQSLEELLAEEQWLENVLRQRLQVHSSLLCFVLCNMYCCDVA